MDLANDEWRAIISNTKTAGPTDETDGGPSSYNINIYHKRSTEQKLKDCNGLPWPSELFAFVNYQMSKASREREAEKNPNSFITRQSMRVA